MKRISIVLVLCAALLTGCQSSKQFQGLYMGSTLGGVFGSAIGGLMGGHRGSDAGAAMGMIIGGAAGAAATAPKDGKSSAGRSRVEDVDDYNRQSNGKRGSVQPGAPAELSALEIENLRFIDANNDRSINAGERARLVFEIHNLGNTAAHNVAPVISISGTKHIIVSPTAIISTIGPGRSVRYTAELYGKPRLRHGMADFQIGFAYGNNYVYTVRTFQLATQE